MSVAPWLNNNKIKNKNKNLDEKGYFTRTFLSYLHFLFAKNKEVWEGTAFSNFGRGAATPFILILPPMELCISNQMFQLSAPNMNETCRQNIRCLQLGNEKNVEQCGVKDKQKIPDYLRNKMYF